ncbi:hypothetical protein M432DRAFT_366080 [Thermoascus aurantiacus ATCC 26904]
MSHVEYILQKILYVEMHHAPSTRKATVHRRFHDPAAIQMCTLMNIKTGGCSEDSLIISSPVSQLVVTAGLGISEWAQKSSSDARDTTTRSWQPVLRLLFL